MTYRLTSRYTSLAVLLAVVLVAGCGRIGRSVGSGLVEGARQAHLDSLVRDIAGEATAGALDAALSDSAQVVLRARIAEIVGELNDSLAVGVDSIRGRLMSAATSEWIASLTSELGDTAALAAGRVRDELLGPRSGDLVDALVVRLREEILGPPTREFLAAARDTLTGPGLRENVDSIVTRAMARIAQEWDSTLTGPITRTLQEAGAVGETVTAGVNKLAITLGVVVAALMILGTVLFVLRQRDRGTLGTITAQIDKMTQRGAYDDLVQGIRTETEKRGLTQHLNRLLQTQDLHEQPEWLNKDRRLSEFLATQLDADAKKAMIDRLETEGDPELAQHLGSTAQVHFS